VHPTFTLFPYTTLFRSRGHPFDQLRLGPTRPRPVAVLAERLVIDLDDDDLAASLVLVEAVAANAQPVLGDLAKPDQAEDEPRERRQQQQFPRLAVWVLI